MDCSGTFELCDTWRRYHRLKKWDGKGENWEGKEIRTTGAVYDDTGTSNQMNKLQRKQTTEKSFPRDAIA